MKTRTILVAGGTVASASLLVALAAIPQANATQSPASPSSTPSPVVVTNTPSQPVPVTGSVAAAQNGPWTVGITGTPNVAVSNLPATQAVEGTVSVANFPATQAVSGAVAISPDGNTVRPTFTTGLVASGSLQTPGNSRYVLFGATDVSQYKEVRIIVQCGGACGGTVLNIFENIPGGYGHPISAYTFQNGVYDNTIDLPLPSLSASIDNTSGLAGLTISYWIVGRGN